MPSIRCTFLGRRDGILVTVQRKLSVLMFLFRQNIFCGFAATIFTKKPFKSDTLDYYGIRRLSYDMWFHVSSYIFRPINVSEEPDIFMFGEGKTSYLPNKQKCVISLRKVIFLLLDTFRMILSVRDAYLKNEKSQNTSKIFNLRTLKTHYSGAHYVACTAQMISTYNYFWEIY
jgi:hypothetical protein